MKPEKNEQNKQTKKSKLLVFSADPVWLKILFIVQLDYSEKCAEEVWLMGLVAADDLD